MIKNIIQNFRAWMLPAKSKTVLVIDDSELDRHLAVSILEKRFWVLTASCGREGLAAAREKKPDLILLDFMMPDMKGPEVCRALKDDPVTQDIPVIFLTSMDTPSTVVDSFEQGAEIYLTKPVSASELTKQVALTLETAFSVKE